MNFEEPRTCLYCEKHLVVIGRQRRNGKSTHDDWASRKLHKKCWRPYEDIVALEKKHLPRSQWKFAK